ncbi:MFS transporter [Nocardioides aequoreus]|uniref:MFS transporter n=1 Tax=Nocardioides aequoreus TaxID=397278 RepID=UPI0004C2D7AF|nr:MFS transporter [Nocardioides aequoreus]
MTRTRERRPSLFRHHDFRQLFLADSASQVGTELAGLAIAVMAVRLLDAGELEMGVLATFEYLAFLVIGLPAGAWVDRWRKRRVLVSADLVRAVALATLPLAWYLGVLTIWQMYAVALAVGTATVFFDVAYQSYLPEIVEPPDIGEGNAKLQAVQSIAMIGGPALGGWLIRLVGAPVTVALNAASFVWSAWFLRRIRHVATPPPREDRRPLWVEVREGLDFVFGEPLLRRIVACTASSNLLSSMTGAMLVIYCLQDLGLDEAQMGLAMGLGAAGGLLGALATPPLTRWLGEGRVIPLSMLTWIPGGVLMPLAGTVVPPMVALTVSSLGLTFSVVVYNVAQVSFRQRLCPRPLLGRMNASIRFCVWGVMPIGGLLGGVIGSTYDARTVFWIGFAGSFVSASFVVFSPLIRMRDLPRALDRLSDTV